MNAIMVSFIALQLNGVKWVLAPRYQSNKFITNNIKHSAKFFFHFSFVQYGPTIFISQYWIFNSLGIFAFSIDWMRGMRVPMAKPLMRVLSMRCAQWAVAVGNFNDAPVLIVVNIMAVVLRLFGSWTFHLTGSIIILWCDAHLHQTVICAIKFY